MTTIPATEWKARYIAKMVAMGVTAEDAEASCDAGECSHDYADNPEDAAGDELQYWDNDEEGAAP